MRLREFRRLQDNDKYRVWRIEVKKDTVIMYSGWLDGKMQSTRRKGEAKNIGRSNEVTVENDAVNWAERQIELKTRDGGYREVDPSTGVFLKGASKKTLNFESPPSNFRVYKPQHSMNKSLAAKLETGEARAYRKLDGNGCVVAMSKKYQVNFFTLKMGASQKDEDPKEYPFHKRYPKLYDLFNTSALSPESMILGELVPMHRDENGFLIDDLDYVNGIRGSLTPMALSTQENQGWLGLVIWDWAFKSGTCLLETLPFKDRFEMVKELVRSDESGQLAYPEVAYLLEPGIITIESTAGDFHIEVKKGHTVQRTLLDLCKDMGWEGFVVIDHNTNYEGKAINFTDAAPRPGSCGKMKPKLEADFIARWDPDNRIGTRGKGKKSVGVGAAFLYLWDPDLQEEVFVCKCGGGLNDENVLKFADPSRYPKVWQVEFSSWTKAGALQFPEFLRERDDKEPDECTIYQRPEVNE